MGESDLRGAPASSLLNELEDILLHDPLIDEVGFVHPTQFSKLNEETPGSGLSSFNPETPEKVSGTEFRGHRIREQRMASFWKRENKLAICTDALLPLYREAVPAFMDSFQKYRTCLQDHKANGDHGNGQHSLLPSLRTLACEVMSHSRALLVLSCDFGTAWNSRKLILSRAEGRDVEKLFDELVLSNLVLSNCPKSTQTWSHRRWVIKVISQKTSSLEDTINRESMFVKNLAGRSRMNYRAWSHCHHLVSYMTFSQAYGEYQKSKEWACCHVADNCIFHYRRTLLLRMLEGSSNSEIPQVFNIYETWKEELEWNQMMIYRYIGREALWVHRRFVSHTWMELCRDASGFIDRELVLVRSCCTTGVDGVSEDRLMQAMHSSSYLLWLAKASRSIHCTESTIAALKSQLVASSPHRATLWNALVAGAVEAMS